MPLQPCKPQSYATSSSLISEKNASIQKEMCFCSTINTKDMMNEEDRLVKILQLSHGQVLEGQSYSQEEAERFLDQRLYEFRNKMVETCVAEPC